MNVKNIEFELTEHEVELLSIEMDLFLRSFAGDMNAKRAEIFNKIYKAINNHNHWNYLTATGNKS